MSKQKSIEEAELEAERLKENIKEWGEIESLIETYQKQFAPEYEYDMEVYEASEEAMEELLRRFSPLFRKYTLLITRGEINFNDPETRSFVYLFVGSRSLKNDLKRKSPSKLSREKIAHNFQFVTLTYGTNSEEDILMDLQLLFMVIAKRYKQIGKNFCGYLYNTYKYEVGRHIEKMLRDVINIPYRVTVFNADIKTKDVTTIEDEIKEGFYEDNLGIPDLKWILGDTCSEVFQGLDNLERKLLVKYYLEEWNDRQISEDFGMHINTVNQKRRLATVKVAENMGLSASDIKRNRRSGKRAIMPI